LFKNRGVAGDISTVGRAQIYPVTFFVLVKVVSAPIFENIPNGKMLLRCDCVIYNSTKDLLTSFFRAWKQVLTKEGYRFKLKRVTYEDARFIFDDKFLEESIEEEIDRILKE